MARRKAANQPAVPAPAAPAPAIETLTMIQEANEVFGTAPDGWRTVGTRPIVLPVGDGKTVQRVIVSYEKAEKRPQKVEAQPQTE